MQITLTKPDLVRFIENEVSSGRFGSAQQVVEELLYRSLERVVDVERDARTCKDIEASEAEFDGGGGVDFRDALLELRKRYDSK